MYDHINQFVNHPDEKIITSLDSILGGLAGSSVSIRP